MGDPCESGDPSDIANGQGTASTVPGKDVGADHDDGEDIGENGADCPSQSQQTATKKGGKFGGFGIPGVPDTGGSYNEALYHEVSSSVKGAVSRMMETLNATNDNDGFLSGPLLGRNLERALIDGRCFARREAEGELLHAVVLLDVSDSMEEVMGAVAAIAQSFAEAVSGMAESSSLAVFSSWHRVVSDFKRAYASGGTATDGAMDYARSFLSDKRGRRVCVVITDGQPNGASRQPTIDITEDMVRQGIDVVAVGYGEWMKPEVVSEVFPGAKIAHGAGPLELLMSLNNVASEIASKG
jgi:hypothetical protein